MTVPLLRQRRLQHHGPHCFSLEGPVANEFPQPPVQREPGLVSHLGNQSRDRTQDHKYHVRNEGSAYQFVLLGYKLTLVG